MSIIPLPPSSVLVALAIAGVRLARKPDKVPPRKNALPTYIAVSSLVAVGSYECLIGSVAPTRPAEAKPPLVARDKKVAPFTKGTGIKLIGSTRFATKAGSMLRSVESSLSLRASFLSIFLFKKSCSSLFLTCKNSSAYFS